MIQDEFAGQVVQRLGHHARNDIGCQHVQALGAQATSLAHAFEPCGVMQLDLAGSVFAVEDVGHQVLQCPMSRC